MTYAGDAPAASYVPPPIPDPVPPEDDPSGTPATGTWLGSFTATEAAISPGDVIDVPAGTYAESFTLAKASVIWRLASGAVVDLSGEGIAIQAAGVVIDGDDVQFIGSGRITGSDGAGYEVNGDRVTVTVEVDNCVEEGYVWHGRDGVMLNGSNHDNDSTGDLYDSSEQGAGKANINGSLLIDGVHVYNIGLGAADEDAGQGLWFDTISGSTPQAWFTGGEVRNCLIHDVFYAGVMFEISRGGSFHDNVIHHCGSTPSGSGFWGAGLLIASSQDVEIASNLIAYCPYSAIRVLGQSRSDSPGAPLRVVSHDNTLLRNGVAIRYDSDNAGIRSTMFASTSGNKVFDNVINEDDLVVVWNGSTLTTLGAINALPGGGGNSTITEAAADAILAAPPIGPAITP